MEIYLSGTWGTVGHDNTDIFDAQVVCRQLGYDTRCKFACIAHLCHPSAPLLLKDGAFDISHYWAYDNFGLGSGSIHLNHLQCTGREQRLINCRHDNNTDHHSEDWGVTCNNGKLTNYNYA